MVGGLRAPTWGKMRSGFGVAGLCLLLKALSWLIDGGEVMVGEVCGGCRECIGLVFGECGAAR